MRPSSHVVAAAGLGVPLYLAGGGPVLAAAASAAMVLIDLDHLVDFLIWGGRPLSLQEFLRPGNTGDWPRVVFVLHAYEWLILLAAAAVGWRSPLLWAVFTGAAGHLVLDEIGNRLPHQPHRIRPLFYFFTYRLWRRFSVAAVSQPRLEAAPQSRAATR